MSMDDNIDDIPDYSDEEKDEQPKLDEKKPADAKQAKRSSDHISVHTSGFRELLLKPELMQAIAAAGFEHPSEVQHEGIPAGILGKDLLIQAKSGLGKTAVFVLSVLHSLEPQDGQVSCLVLVHTRELAFQIHNEFKRFCKFLPIIKIGVFYGGTAVANDRSRLSVDPPHIVIGTPGRIRQLVEENTLQLKHLKHFILDECDSLLEPNDMRKDVQRIFTNTPHDKQVMMFTATLNDEMKGICKKFMHHPLEIYINDGAKLTLHGIQQYYCKLEEANKNRKLVDLLDKLEFNQVIIFVKSIRRAEVLNKLLMECQFPSVVTHSSLAQEERISRYKSFKEFRCRIMVATSLFGRGVDFTRVNVVINYDVPKDADEYLHKVGRAGRFGTKGLAISFVVSESDKSVIDAVSRRFVVTIPELPDDIEAASYLNS
eukprot:TRINITY_DN6939_c0_g1_i2.p1 TRINITY_DN6939_c0_g1~~TRINITY_DN6939_c0_g1_i2.p1  ORF type:complete len:438 (+),score=83.21 TRINITY_DN6939_c0_g1_i2:29-1315(+)